jgi:hypothetical protein
MISVENFYWILQRQLLEPSYLDSRYFYPFGTTETLVCSVFRPSRAKNDHNVFFFYDQEPLYDNAHDLIPTATHAGGNRQNALRIIATSEISDFRKQICKQYDLIDWYYFYHGFAALDWFRDAQYIVDDHPLVNSFVSFNHQITGDRSYRMSLVARLFDKKILDRGTVSFFGNKQSCQIEINDPYTRLTDQEKELIIHWSDNSALPLFADASTVDSSYSARFGINDYRAWQGSFLHVVNETVFYHPKLHLTEKIFKPIVAMRPFVLVAAPGNLDYLKSYGFQTFSKWIDESYDHVIDHQQRLDHIADEIARISRYPIHTLEAMLKDMKTVLEHNKNHFFNEFKDHIVDEMVDNFDQCLRRWNNGRVSRCLPLHPDLESVKNLFKKI